jgi:hypothetical protein
MASSLIALIRQLHPTVTLQSIADHHKHLYLIPGSNGDSGETHADRIQPDCHPSDDGKRRSTRARKQRDLGFYLDCTNLAINSVAAICKNSAQKIPVPRSVSEALRGPNASDWSRAIESELASHAENGTWSLVDPPTDTNRRTIGCMWVFKVLYDQTTGAVERFKARLVK